MKKTILTSASLLALAGMIGIANAQETDVDEEVVDTIVVTGKFADSLAKSLETKRYADSVVEALAAEDIGALPEISVAEALERLPGLAGQRDRGNTSQLSIRGLGPDLSLGTLNGREIATPDPDRIVNYSQFPGELINAAIIYKSPKASLIEGGVAGTIELKTLRPLDYDDRRLNLTARYGYSELGGDLTRGDPSSLRGSLSYVDQFANDTLGIAVGLSAFTGPSTDVRDSQFGFTNSFRDLDGDGVSEDAISFGYSGRVRTGQDDRLGALFVAEYEPSENFNLIVDAMYSLLDIENFAQGFEVGSFNRFSNTVANGAVENGALVAGDVTGVNLNLQSTFGGRDDTFFSLGALAEWDFDKFNVKADLSYSHVDFFGQFTAINAQVHDLSGAEPVPVSGITASVDTRSGSVDLSVSEDLSDVATVLPVSLSTPFYRDGEDEVFSAQVDASYPLNTGFFEKIDFGVRFRDREKSSLQLSQSGSIAAADRVPFSASSITTNPLGSYSGNGANGFIPFFGFDFFDAVDLFGGLNPTSNPNGNDETASWVVEESTLAGYVQANFSNEKISGNLGVRVIKTESTSSSARRFNAAGGINEIVPIAIDNDYTDVLPALNISYYPVEDIILRFGLAKTIARAPMDDLNAGFRRFSFGADNAFGGNPLLEPFRTDQVDLTAEWYYGEDSALTVSGFYKELNSFITTGTTDLVDETGAPFTYFQPINGEGGSLSGFEILWQQRLPIPEQYGSAGIYANWAHSDSEIEVPRNFSDDVLPLLGLSDDVWNATLWYSYGKFDGRLNYRDRSDFAREFDGGGFGLDSGEGVFDAHLSYKLNDNLTFLAQGQDLTESSVSSYFVDPARIGRTEVYGRRYWVGFNANF